MDEEYETHDNDDETPTVIQEDTTLDDLLNDCKPQQERVEAYEDELKSISVAESEYLEEIEDELTETKQELTLVQNTVPLDVPAKRTLEQRVSDLMERRRNVKSGARKDTFLVNRELLNAKDDLEKCRRLRELGEGE